MSDRAAATFIVAAFAFIFAVAYIGDRYGPVYFLATLTVGAYLFVRIANHRVTDDE
jgi:hypothetical protein